MIDNDLLLKTFPFKEPRPNQLESVKEIIKSFSSGNNIFILESPTGTGKSGVAYTVGNYLLEKNKIVDDPLDIVNKFGEKFPKCLIITHSKSLQQQYSDSFKNKNLKTIWSSEGFECIDPDKKIHDITYGTPGCSKSKCEYYNNCPYIIQKKAFLNSKIGVCNYHYFLTNEVMKTRYLILDESHNLEKILCDIAEIQISNYLFFNIRNTVSKIKNIKFDHLGCIDLLIDFIKKETMDKKEILLFFKLILEKISPVCVGLEKECAKYEKLVLEDSKDEHSLKMLVSLHKTIQLIQNFIKKVSIFRNSETDWVISEKEWKNDPYFTLKPLYVYEFFNLLQSKCEYILMMSATICGAEQFAKDIGINKYEYYYTNMIIPAKNRLIYNLNAGTINYKNKMEMLPKFINCIDHIIDKMTANWTKPLNGIIHAISKDNATEIIKKSKYKDKMKIPDRYDLLNIDKFFEKDNVILVSYNMLEGIDLKDDKSRIQFFPKLPYASLGDLWVKTRLSLDSKWYDRECIIKLVQGSGRSIRSEQDWAFTYILDSNFDRLLRNSKNLFPKWFLEAIKNY